MILVKIVLASLVFWYLCGIVNVAAIQTAFGDDDFSIYNRNATLWVCYGSGPVMTTAILGYGLVIKPVKYGTRLGRFLGRKLEDILD